MAPKGGRNDHEIVKVSEVDSSSWRLRDAAHRLLYRRYGPENETVAPRQAASNMTMSSQLDGTACLERIRRDRANVARSAFDAAATAVLEAIEKTLEQHVKKQKRKSLTMQQEDLPPFLSQWLRLEELRLVSMERAHNNKSYAKRSVPPDSRGMNRGRRGRPKADLPMIGEAIAEPVLSSVEEVKDASSPIKSKELPKFTRNTPASSAAALDSRSINSRAILCTAGNVSFEMLTPPLPGYDIDVTDIPQNPAKHKEEDDEEAAAIYSAVNMGNVVVEAQAMGQRAVAVATNASRRATQRYRYRKDNIQFDTHNKSQQNKQFFRMKNPFQWKAPGEHDDEEDATACLYETTIPYQPHSDAITVSWAEHCVPRFLSILKTGSGHAFYHDLGWNTRHGRIANLFQVLAQEQGIYGTHLIITTEPEVARFAQEFQPVNRHQTLLTTVSADSLRALAYTGNKEQRRKLRYFFAKGTGLVDSPYHVIITSYKSFLDNYLHFCQVPFENVVVDDGASWMATARSDPNSPIGTLWDTAIWSTKDHVGLAGTGFKRWDFMLDDIPLQAQKDAWVGLTTRSRIMTGAPSEVSQRFSGDVMPVTGLVEFVAPQFANAVSEEWDRSKIHTDSSSMEHFRQLLTRSTVVHGPGEDQNMRTLAMDALNGRLPAPEYRSDNPRVPDIIVDETFVNDGKVAFSRRASLLWLGDPETSWLRYELGTASFKPILDAQSKSNTFGYFCEESVPASTTTSSGQSGQVTGSMAYRLAMRCNRHFGSEQGLRQHLSAVHAPPGTWLCRTCGSDCITSQSRTHHERQCGQPTTVISDPNDPKGVGARGNFGPVGVVGKKKGKSASAQGSKPPVDKDSDGSFRVPGYRGVWVNPKGKHFVKIKDTRQADEGGEGTQFFDNIEDAAKRHDTALKKLTEKEEDEDEKIELNFQEDGTRIVYEDTTSASSTGLGGSANNVVPALSVINIKDLPQDVKPLLRDPRQTSRTGGNSKRHIYAYRGVCRQARKGHDRWQSQISFMGVNHYLGTFDSEWDAAAIYSWAHLILYGEEATRQAQLEGEEAAAAYEQEKKDIAEGKVKEPEKKPKKEKKPKEKKPDKEKNTDKKKKQTKNADGNDTTPDEAVKKRQLSGDDGAGPESKKKKKPGPKPGPKITIKAEKKVDKESIAPVLAKGVYRAFSLAARDDYQTQTDAELMESTISRVKVVRDNNYHVVDTKQAAVVDDMMRPSLPQSAGPATGQRGAAMLLGLSALHFGWDVDVFVSSRVFASVELEKNASAALNAEVSANENFCTMIQGPLCVIGNASPSLRKAHKQLGLGAIPLGSSVGEIDCHIGGTLLSCSETAATIRYAPTTAGAFQFAAVADEDIVTLNGKRITPGMGSFPLFNEDICTVGARVFVFLLPKDKK